MIEIFSHVKSMIDIDEIDESRVYYNITFGINLTINFFNASTLPESKLIYFECA